MKKLVLFMHASLDGFVAGPNGEMDWIKVNDELFEYATRQTEEADTALYGRVTYEMMDSYWPTAADQPNASRHDIEHSKWYKKVQKVVVSNTLPANPGHNTITLSNNIPSEIQKLKQSGGDNKNILMFGSPSTAHSLLRDKLIDVFWIFVNPVLLGKGIPLFNNVNDKIDLQLKESKKLDSGVVGLHYEVQR